MPKFEENEKVVTPEAIVSLNHNKEHRIVELGIWDDEDSKILYDDLQVKIICLLDHSDTSPLAKYALSFKKW